MTGSAVQNWKQGSVKGGYVKKAVENLLAHLRRGTREVFNLDGEVIVVSDDGSNSSNSILAPLDGFSDHHHAGPGALGRVWGPKDLAVSESTLKAGKMAREVGPPDVASVKRPLDNPSEGGPTPSSSSSEPPPKKQRSAYVIDRRKILLRKFQALEHKRKEIRRQLKEIVKVDDQLAFLADEMNDLLEQESLD